MAAASDLDADVALYGPIPDIISMALDFLATYYTSSKYRHEGLFTQPGVSADVDMILDGWQEGCVTKLEDLFFLTQNPHTIGLLIVECLNLLPAPLLPPSLFLSIVPLCGGGTMCENEERESANALRALFEDLPEIQCSVLENIFHFLHLLFTTTKLLSLSSLSSLSLALLQLDPSSPSPPAPPPRQLEDVMSFFVRHADALFGIYHIENVSDLARDYDILHDLGEGQFGVAKKIVHKKTHLPFAVKIIPKQKLDAKERSRLATEIQILKRARHPNIIGLRGVCDTPDALLLIMELAEGGDLFDFLQTRATYQEDQAIEITKQIISALCYLHRLNIVHRDIKPENIFLKHRDTLHIKLADFGLSKMFDPDVRLSTKCGTPCYVAPEILTDDHYGPEVDMWSVGVVVYLLLSGTMPFDGENPLDVYQNILNGEYNFKDEDWEAVSVEGIDFVLQLLSPSPQSRLTAAAALQHPWLNSTIKGDAPLFTADDVSSTRERGSVYRKSAKMNADVLQQTVEDVGHIRKSYREKRSTVSIDKFEKKSTEFRAKRGATLIDVTTIPTDTDSAPLPSINSDKKGTSLKRKATKFDSTAIGIGPASSQAPYSRASHAPPSRESQAPPSRASQAPSYQPGGMTRVPTGMVNVPSAIPKGLKPQPKVAEVKPQPKAADAKPSPSPNREAPPPPSSHSPSLSSSPSPSLPPMDDKVCPPSPPKFAAPSAPILVKDEEASDQSRAAKRKGMRY